MKTKGFTLIELLVVISVIALLSSVVLASLNSARDKGRMGAAKYFATEVDHVEGDYLIGSWDFDECSGTAAADRSPSGNVGALQGSPSWSASTPFGTGCSLSFNGTSQYVLLPKIDSQVTNAVTISAWIYPTNANGGYQGIAGNCTSCGFFSFLLSGQLVFDITTNNGRILTSKGTVVNNAWQHVAMTYDGATMNWYIDGKLIGTAAQTGTINQASSARIGYSGYSTEYFQGSIDGVHIFAKALTAQEIGKLYAAESRNKKFALK